MITEVEWNQRLKILDFNYWTKRTSFDLDNWLSSHLLETQFKRGK